MRKTDEPDPVPHATLAQYRQCVKALLQLAPSNAPGEEIEPTTVGLSKDAKSELKQFMAWIEPQLAPGAELGAMTDWAGKLAGTVARIAGVLYMMDLAGHASVHAPLRVPKGRYITAQTLLSAIELANYFAAHARAAFAEMGADPTVEAAKHILRWIERKGIDEFTKRDALTSHGHIREQDTQEPRKRGRPSIRYEVNPHSGDKISRISYSQYSQYSQKPVEEHPIEGE